MNNAFERGIHRWPVDPTHKWPVTRKMCPSDGVIMELTERNGTSPIVIRSAWWCYQMETFSALLALFRGIQRSPVDSPHKGQYRGASMFVICAWTNGWGNNSHYDVTGMTDRLDSQSQFTQKQDVPAILTSPHRSCTTPLNIRNVSLVIDLMPINISIPAVTIHVFFF